MINRFSTLINTVLGVKNVVWSRGKAWGVYGRQFLLRFSNYSSNPNFIECIHFIDNSFMIIQSSKKKERKKKDNKKAS